jgi:hypothetical protein
MYFIVCSYDSPIQVGPEAEALKHREIGCSETSDPPVRGTVNICT